MKELIWPAINVCETDYEIEAAMNEAFPKQARAWKKRKQKEQKKADNSGSSKESAKRADFSSSNTP